VTQLAVEGTALAGFLIFTSNGKEVAGGYSSRGFTQQGFHQLKHRVGNRLKTLKER
jgi:hypothetical protein